MSSPRFSASILFQPTPSAWRATAMKLHLVFNDDPFQPTPSAWRATPAGSRWPADRAISTHALRVEGDRKML